jgi:Fe-S cluster assembly protein SufD
MSTTVHEKASRFRALLFKNNEPSWLKTQREEGLSLYETLLPPSPPSRDRNFPTFDPESLDLVEAKKASWDLLENQNAVVLPLAEALWSYEEKIAPYFGKIVLAQKNKWIALNQAFWQEGVFIYVPKNMDAGTILLQQAVPEKNSLFLPRVFVFVEPGGRLSFLEQYESKNLNEVFSLPVIEILALENSEVNYVHLQKWGSQTHHHAFVKVLANRDSRVNLLSCAFGGKRAVHNLEITLKGEGAQAQILGIVVGKGDQVFEHYTLQEHLASQTESDLLVKTALKERAYSHFDGLIWIEKGARKTNAYQQNRNLLLSKEAKAESIPRLEILDNDVRCTHGASIGPVDEEQVFYLESRGIAPEEAEALIVEGFFQQVLERIPSKELREKIEQEVIQNLS